MASESGSAENPGLVISPNNKNRDRTTRAEGVTKYMDPKGFMEDQPCHILVAMDMRKTLA